MKAAISGVGLAMTFVFCWSGWVTAQNQPPRNAPRSENPPQDFKAPLKVGHSVEFLSFSADDALIAAGGDGKVHILEFPSGKNVDLCLSQNGKSRAVGPLAFSPVEAKLAFSHSKLPQLGHDSTIEIWDLKDKKVILTFKEIPSYVTALAYNPDGKMLAASIAKGGGAVRIWNMETGNVLNTIEKTDFQTQLIFHPNGKILLGSGLGGIRCWNVETGTEIAKHSEAGIFFSSLAINPVGTTVAAYNGDFVLLDLKLGAETSLVKNKSLGLGKEVVIELGAPMQFSPDGQLFAYSSKKIVRVLDVASGKVKATLKPPQLGETKFIAFSTDGKLLTSAITNGTVQTWNIEKELQRTGGKQ